MTDRFSIEEIKDGIKYYGKKHCKTPSCMNFFHEIQLLEKETLFQKIVSLLLIPLTFNPHSYAFVLYETVRVVLILVTVFLVPFQVICMSLCCA